MVSWQRRHIPDMYSTPVCLLIILRRWKTLLIGRNTILNFKLTTTNSQETKAVAKFSKNIMRGTSTKRRRNTRAKTWDEDVPEIISKGKNRNERYKARCDDDEWTVSPPASVQGLVSLSVNSPRRFYPPRKLYKGVVFPAAENIPVDLLGPAVIDLTNDAVWTDGLGKVRIRVPKVQ